MRIASLGRKLIGIAVLVALLRGYTDTFKDTLGALFDLVRINAAEMEMNQLHKVLMSFYIAQTRYPRKDDGELRAWFEEHYDYQVQSAVTDPWDCYYYFLIPEYEITCNGPDLMHMTRDDIVQPYPLSVRR